MDRIQRTGPNNAHPARHGREMIFDVTMLISHLFTSSSVNYECSRDNIARGTLDNAGHVEWWQHYTQHHVVKDDEYPIHYGNAAGMVKVLDEGYDDVVEVVEDTAEREEWTVCTESPPTY